MVVNAVSTVRLPAVIFSSFTFLSAYLLLMTLLYMCVLYPQQMYHCSLVLGK